MMRGGAVVARQAHNLEVLGSNPSGATITFHRGDGNRRGGGSGRLPPPHRPTEVAGASEPVGRSLRVAAVASGVNRKRCPPTG